MNIITSLRSKCSNSMWCVQKDKKLFKIIKIIDKNFSISKKGTGLFFIEKKRKKLNQKASDFIVQSQTFQSAGLNYKIK